MNCIVYEDNDIIVCHKPAGIAVQTRRVGQADMESELKNYRVSNSEKPYIGIIHRLDQPVEGLIVFAKSREAAANLSGQVAGREFLKYYYALVQISGETGDDEFGVSASGNIDSGLGDSRRTGHMNDGWVTLTDYIIHDKRNNTSRIAAKDEPGAKRAKLDYRIINRKEKAALVDICLHTGRHHQIRVQMANAGMPLIGDKKYGAGEDFESTGKYGDTLALCAYRLEFSHPVSGKKLSFEIMPKWAE